jgi:hypothetical protein
MKNIIREIIEAIILAALFGGPIIYYLLFIMQP